MTKISGDIPFNTAPSTYMHIDLNSCFASVEQQANPLLRGRPIGVAAYNSPKGVILASSIEAKKLGIKTGTRVFEAKKVCPSIVILEPDPDKYRFVHRALKTLLLSYTDKVEAKSVDEFVLDFKNSPFYSKGMLNVGAEIKKRIKEEIGDYLTVSVGISKNRFLAKTASNLEKPDGLQEISEQNFENVYQKLELMDLCGISTQNFARLTSHGIHTVTQFYLADPMLLKNVFSSVVGNYWYFRLRGYEIENRNSKRRSFGHQYALPKPAKSLKELTPILAKLTEKLGLRLRNNGYAAQGIHLFLKYKDGSFWHMGKKTKRPMYDSKDIYKELLRLYGYSFQNEMVLIGITCFNLRNENTVQLELFSEPFTKIKLTNMLDKINNKWGKFVISPANMVGAQKYVPDRIGFGSIEP